MHCNITMRCTWRYEHINGITALRCSVILRCSARDTVNTFWIACDTNCNVKIQVCRNIHRQSSILIPLIFVLTPTDFTYWIMIIIIVTGPGKDCSDNQWRTMLCSETYMYLAPCLMRRANCVVQRDVNASSVMPHASCRIHWTMELRQQHVSFCKHLHARNDESTNLLRTIDYIFLS